MDALAETVLIIGCAMIGVALGFWLGFKTALNELKLALEITSEPTKNKKKR